MYMHTRNALLRCFLCAHVHAYAHAHEDTKAWSRFPCVRVHAHVHICAHVHAHVHALAGGSAQVPRTRTRGLWRAHGGQDAACMHVCVCMCTCRAAEMLLEEKAKEPPAMKWTGWAAQPYYENDGGSLLLVYSSTGEVRAASARTRLQLTPHHPITSPSPSPLPPPPTHTRTVPVPVRQPQLAAAAAVAPVHAHLRARARRWRWAGRAESYKAPSTRETRWVMPCACMCMMYVHLAAHPSPPLAIAQRLSLRLSLHCRACSPSYARRAMWPRPVLESAEPATNPRRLRNQPHQPHAAAPRDSSSLLRAGRHLQGTLLPLLRPGEAQGGRVRPSKGRDRASSLMSAASARGRG